MAKSLKELRDEARRCRDCPLWANATLTIATSASVKTAVRLFTSHLPLLIENTCGRVAAGRRLSVN